MNLFLNLKFVFMASIRAMHPCTGRDPIPSAGVKSVINNGVGSIWCRVPPAVHGFTMQCISLHVEPSPHVMIVVPLATLAVNDRTQEPIEFLAASEGISSM